MMTGSTWIRPDLDWGHFSKTIATILWTILAKWCILISQLSFILGHESSGLVWSGCHGLTCVR